MRLHRTLTLQECKALFRDDQCELPKRKTPWASGFCENGQVGPWAYTLSASVTSGNPCPSFIQDIDGRIFISVVDSAAIRTLPLSDRQRQFIQNVPTAVTHLAGREEAINFMNIRA